MKHIDASIICLIWGNHIGFDMKRKPNKTGNVLCACFLLSIAMASVYARSDAPNDSLPTYFSNNEYQLAVKNALCFQAQADSLQRIIEMQTLSLSSVPEVQKSGIKVAIRNNDAQAAAAQKKADDYYAQISKYEVQVANNAVEPVIESIVPEKVTPTALIISAAENMPKPSEEKTVLAGDFAILANSPYSTSNPIPVDVALPEGVTYKIQLGAFSKPVAANAFKGLTPISKEPLPNGVTKYYVGVFRQHVNADVALRKVHEYGYKDAFIVAFYNKKVITLDRAKQLEK